MERKRGQACDLRFSVTRHCCIELWITKSQNRKPDAIQRIWRETGHNSRQTRHICLQTFRIRRKTRHICLQTSHIRRET